jgi:hypothetical protein
VCPSAVRRGAPRYMRVLLASEASRCCLRTNAPRSKSKVKPTSCRYSSVKRFSNMWLTVNFPVRHFSIRMTANCRQRLYRFSLHLLVGNRTIHSFSNPVSVVLELASLTMAVNSRPNPHAVAFLAQLARRSMT